MSKAILTEETKICHTCQAAKPLSMFAKWRLKCRACKSTENSARLKERYANDPKFVASVKKRAAQWQMKNAEKSNEYRRRRHANKMAKGDSTYLARISTSQRRYRESKKGKATTAARMRTYEESGQVKTWHNARRTKPESRTSQMLASVRSRAVKYNIKFSLLFDDIYPHVAAGRCVKTGIVFDLNPHADYRVHPFAPSIDRIDAAKGYTKDNVQIVCWAYNLARNEYGDDVLLTLARAIVDANR